MSASEAMEWVTVAAVALLVLLSAAAACVLVWAMIRNEKRRGP